MRIAVGATFFGLVQNLTGCSYFRDRFRDSLDIVWLDTGPAVALGVDAQVTDLVHQGIGLYYRAFKAGMRGRQPDLWKETGFLARYCE